MSVGIVMLDPERLARLEGRLQTSAETLALRNRSIELAVAGTTHSADAEMAVLRVLGRWCQDQRADVTRRRLLVAALPASLPLPRTTFTTRGLALAAAELTAGRLRDWLDEEIDLSWAETQQLFTEVRRNQDDPTYAAELFRTLGPAFARELGERVHARWPSGPSPAAEGPGSPLPQAQAAIVRALGAASRAVGRDRLGEDWFRTFGGLEPGDTGRDFDDETKARVDRTQDTLKKAGWSTDAAEVVSVAAGRRRVIPVVSKAGGVLAVVGIASWALDMHQGDLTDDQAGIQLLAAGLSLAAVFVPPPFNAAVIGMSGLFTLIGLVTGTQNRRAPGRRRNTETGRDEYPSGSPSNPDVDHAGVPAPR